MKKCGMCDFFIQNKNEYSTCKNPKSPNYSYIVFYTETCEEFTDLRQKAKELLNKMEK